MNRSETITVWEPTIDDDVFTVDIDGISRESITNDDDEYIGTAMHGDRVTFEFRFPTASVDPERILDAVLESHSFEYGPQGQENRYVVYDVDQGGAFDIGIENDHTLVVHPKRNCTSAVIIEIYNRIKSVESFRVQVKRYWYEL